MRLLFYFLFYILLSVNAIASDNYEFYNKKVSIEEYKDFQKKIIDNPYHFLDKKKDNTLAISIEEKKYEVYNKSNKTLALKSQTSIDKLKLEQYTFELIESLANSIIKKDNYYFDIYFKNFMNELQKTSLNLAIYEKTFNELNIDETITSKEISVNLKMLKIYIDNLNELTLLISNSKQNFFIKEYLLNKININKIVNILDYSEFGTSVNHNLLLTTITYGKIILCLSIILISLLVRYFIIFMLKVFISKKKVFMQNLRYLSVFILYVGLYLSIIVVYYPNDIPTNFSHTMNVLLILLTTFLTYKISREIALYEIDLIENQNNIKTRKELINIGIKFVNFAIFVIGFLFILLEYNINITYIVSTLGVGSLALALASKDTLSNIFAGIIILLENSYSQGDWIENKNVEGTVVEIGLRSTLIRTFENALVIVPNTELTNTAITNWDKRKIGRRIKIELKITVDSDLKIVKKCVNDIRKMLMNHAEIANHQTKFTDKNRELKVVSLEDQKGVKKNLYVCVNDISSNAITIMIYCFSKTINWEDWLNVKEDVILKCVSIIKKHELSFFNPNKIKVDNEDNKSDMLKQSEQQTFNPQ